MNKRRTYTLEADGARCLSKMLHWAANRLQVCWLDGKGFHADESDRLGLLAVGAIAELHTDRESLKAFDELFGSTRDWLFGFLSYDLKNELEALASSKPDSFQVPHLHFVCPEFVFDLRKDKVMIHYANSMNEQELSNLWDEILAVETETNPKARLSQAITCNFSKHEYTDCVEQILNHIQLGDIYEMNFCVKFEARVFEIQPVDLFMQYQSIVSNPFSCFYRYRNTFLLGNSPERFFVKKARTISSQPMKGTIRRGKDEAEDLMLKEQLRNDIKERAENVMIVDLVRNDLSKIAKRKSVKVDELFGIYTFPNVHQMISTVTAELRDEIRFTDIVRALFPMGSMTGAPKIRAMQIIDEMEHNNRGLFSGAVGYIDPNENMDFNVVIRSMQYQSDTGLLSYQAGSAITSNSNPANEYEECMLKAGALFRLFDQKL